MNLVRSLISYARESESNLAKIKEWRDEALESMARGRGGQLVSGSGNGVSFSIDSTSLTVSQWFDALQQVLDTFERGRSPVSIAQF